VTRAGGRTAALGTAPPLAYLGPDGALLRAGGDRR
jgi:hypothetical protein